MSVLFHTEHLYYLMKLVFVPQGYDYVWLIVKLKQQDEIMVKSWLKPTIN